MESLDDLDADKFSKALPKASKRDLSKVWFSWSAVVWNERDGSAGIFDVLETMGRCLLENEVPVPSMTIARSPASTWCSALLDRESANKKHELFLTELLSHSPSFDVSMSLSGVSDVVSRMESSCSRTPGFLFINELEKKSSESFLVSCCERGLSHVVLFSDRERFLSVANEVGRKMLPNVLSWGYGNALLKDFHFGLLTKEVVSGVVALSKEGSSGGIIAKAKACGALSGEDATSFLVAAMATDEKAYETALNEGFLPEMNAWEKALEEQIGLPEEKVFSMGELVAPFDFRGAPQQGCLMLD